MDYMSPHGRCEYLFDSITHHQAAAYMPCCHGDTPTLDNVAIVCG